MDLRTFQYVLAVVDHGGFTNAARAMQVAQPSLSQAVRTLEAELGVELFHRTTRSVRLSAAGEAFVEPARRAVRDAATARAAVAEVVGLDAGHLDLVSLPTLAVHPTADLIGRFRQAHPAVTVRLTEPADADAAADRVRDATSEIGLSELPVDGADLISHRLETQEFVALLPHGLADELGRGERITLEVLSRQPMITTPTGTSTRRQLDDSIAAAGLTSNVAVETDHREAIGALVAAGAGVAIVPRDVALANPVPDIAVRRISPRITRDIGLIHRDAPLSPAAQSFCDIALRREGHPTRPRPRRR